MNSKYIVRLDDACPTMDQKKWQKIEDLLDRYDIQPIIAVIPNNQNPEQKKKKEDTRFWEKIKRWQNKGWHIALHGYDHVYITNQSGLVPFNNISEFAGLEYEQQEVKIKKGMSVFKDKNINTNIWSAPAHTFDENTLKVLKNNTSMKIVSDGIALFPYNKYGFKWIPQQLWYFRKMPFGVWTSCFHPNEILDEEFDQLKDFIEKNHKDFIDINDLEYKESYIINYIFEKIYWIYRKFKK